MKKNKNYDKSVVTGKLARLGVVFKERLIYIPENVSLGIKMWGMVDYLCGTGSVWTRTKPQW